MWETVKLSKTTNKTVFMKLFSTHHVNVTAITSVLQQYDWRTIQSAQVWVIGRLKNRWNTLTCRMKKKTKKKTKYVFRNAKNIKLIKQALKFVGVQRTWEIDVSNMLAWCLDAFCIIAFPSFKLVRLFTLRLQHRDNALLTLHIKNETAQQCWVTWMETTY